MAKNIQRGDTGIWVVCLLLCLSYQEEYFFPQNEQSGANYCAQFGDDQQMSQMEPSQVSQQQTRDATHSLCGQRKRHSNRKSTFKSEK